MGRTMRVLVVAVMAVSLAVIDAPWVSAAPRAGSERASAAVQAADPAPRSEPRDLAGELGGGAPAVNTSGGRSGGSGPVPESARVAEETQFRSEGSETFRLRDGSKVTEFYGQPKWFRDAKGAWAKVDPKFMSNADGSVSATGVGFDAWIGASQEGVQLGFEGRDVSFRLLGRDGVRPELDAKDATIVWLRDVWAGVDAKYTLSGTGVKEEFVVSSPEALAQPGVFASTLSSEGVLVGDSRRPGGLAVDWNGNGRTAADGEADGPKVSLDPPVVTTAKGAVIGNSGAVYSLDARAEFDSAAKGAVGRRVRPVGVGVDAAALAKLPTDAFPVSVDPSFTVIPASMGGSWASYNSAGNLSTGSNQWGLLGNWRIFEAPRVQWRLGSPDTGSGWVLL